MKTKINKEQLLAELQEIRNSIPAEASALPVEKRDVVFLGTWSVKALLAHLAGWDYTNIEAPVIARPLRRCVVNCLIGPGQTALGRAGMAPLKFGHRREEPFQ